MSEAAATPRQRKMLHTLLPRNPAAKERQRFLEILRGQPPPERIAGSEGETWPEPGVIEPER